MGQFSMENPGHFSVEINTTASHRPSKAASSDAPRNHHSAHYRWWTLSRTLNPRQCGQPGRLRTVWDDAAHGCLRVPPLSVS